MYYKRHFEQLLKTLISVLLGNSPRYIVYLLKLYRQYNLLKADFNKVDIFKIIDSFLYSLRLEAKMLPET